jgi:hypothetical protein
MDYKGDLTVSDHKFKTLSVMVEMFCRHKHTDHGAGKLCPRCSELLEYAGKRLAGCPLKENKTSCQRCHIHCYSPDMRKRISEVMRFAGPRMLLCHPLSALRHLRAVAGSNKKKE